MSRKKKSGKSKSSPSAKSSAVSRQSGKPVNWLKIGERLFIAAVLIGVVSYSVAAYMDRLEVEQDLSVIGNGTSTVVQIHDPDCRLCQALKSNLDSVKGDFKDDIQFKIANIKTKKGREFSRLHRVQHVTLLFFDQQGRRVDTIQGVTSSADIAAALTSLSGK